MTTRRLQLALVIGVAIVLGMALLFGRPAVVSASTNPEPSLPACELGLSTIEAGMPLELSGVTRTPEGVGIMAAGPNGAHREGSVAIVGQRWDGVILFGAADGGAWTVGISVDGEQCLSPLLVTLPAGVVAPPTRSPDDPALLEEPLGGISSATIWSIAGIAALAVVVAAILALIVVAAAATVGRRPLERRPVRRLTQVAIFVTVLAAALFAAFFLYVTASFAHMSSGFSDVERAILELAMAVLAIGGAVAGTLAAGRVPARRADGSV